MIQKYNLKDAEVYSMDYQVAIENKCPYCKSNLMTIKKVELQNYSYYTIKWCSSCKHFFKLTEKLHIQKDFFDGRGIVYDVKQIKENPELTKMLKDKFKILKEIMSKNG